MKHSLLVALALTTVACSGELSGIAEAPAADPVPPASDPLPPEERADSGVIAPPDAAEMSPMEDAAPTPPTCTKPMPPSTGFFVAPTGRATAKGTLEDPWDLATALAGPTALTPGSTVWLRGGTYRGGFLSRATGTAAAPITFRGYPGEWPVVDSGGTGKTSFQISGAFTTFRDLEIMNTDAMRDYPTTGSWTGRTTGLDIHAEGVRIINAVVHDTGVVGWWSTAPNSEIYGLISFNNGWDALDRPHGHGLYLQNEKGTKRLEESLVFHNFSYGVHAYTEKGSLIGMHLIGNVWFGNGLASKKELSFTRDCLIGGSTPARDIVLRDNFGYRPMLDAGALQLGYDSSNGDVTLTGNYQVGLTNFARPWSSIVASKNTFIGGVKDLDRTKFPDNAFLAERPTKSEVFVRPNKYEEGRANVIVYNWGGADSIAVDLSKVLTPGAKYVVQNAQDYLGKPVLSGVYDGTAVKLPLDGLLPVQPIGVPTGLSAAERTGKAFNVFVVRTLSCE